MTQMLSEWKPLRYPRRWAIAFWLTAVGVVWLVSYVVQQGELLVAERQATAAVTAWLTTHTTAEERILAEFPIAGRLWLEMPHAQTVAGIRPWLNLLQEEQPEWVVGDGSLSWQLLAQSTWFQRRYQLAHSQPPYTVWQRTVAPRPLPAPRHILIHPMLTVVGVTVSPSTVQVGQDVAVSLALRAEEAVTRPLTLRLELRPTAHLTPPIATTTRTLPTEIPLVWWDAPLVVQEVLLLNISTQAERGQYVVVGQWLGLVDGRMYEVVLGEITVE